MTLRLRLAFLFAASIAAIVAAGGSFFVHQLGSELNKALDTSLLARADALAQQVAPDGSVTDFQDGSGNGSVVSEYQALAQVIGPAGKVVETSQGAGNQPLLTSVQLTSARRGVLKVNASVTGEPVRLLALPVADSASPPTVVVVGASRDVELTALQRVNTALWLGGPIAVVLGAIGAWLLSGAVLRPVERMRAQASEISAGDTGARLEVPRRRDEISRLGETMNAMLGRLQRALHQQRMFVADAGHELRTPLTMLRAELELAGRPGRDQDGLVAAVHAAALDTDRLIQLAENLLTLARADENTIAIRHDLVQMDELVSEAIASFDTPAAAESIRVMPGQVDPIAIIGDRTRLRQVVDNLLDNALRYSPSSSIVIVNLRAATPAGGVVVDVLDRGPGFPPEFLPRAFDRFSRADAARTDGAGSGLGLAIVAALVAAHGGTVTASNRPDGGASVRVELPDAGARKLLDRTAMM